MLITDDFIVASDRRHGGGSRRLASWTLRRTFTSTMDRTAAAHASEFHDSRKCVCSAFQYNIYTYIYSFLVPDYENVLNRHVYAAHFRYRSDDERLAVLYYIIFILCISGYVRRLDKVNHSFWLATFMLTNNQHYSYTK